MKNKLMKMGIMINDVDRKFKSFMRGEVEIVGDKSGNKLANSGFGTIELVLIIFVLVTLVILFKDKAIEVVNKYLKQVDPKFTR